MSNIVNDFDSGIITISQSYNIYSTQSSTVIPYFDSPGQEFIVSFVQLAKVKKFTEFSYLAAEILEDRWLDIYYRISRNGNAWTDWLSLISHPDLEGSFTNFPAFDPLDKMWMDIKFKRGGSMDVGTIKLLYFKIEGELLRQESDDTITINTNSQSVIRAPHIYKVFKINDFEVISSGNSSEIDIKYRFSQDNSRTWSEWEPLTKENISTKRINPIRFFQIEYLVSNNSSSGKVRIQDINLIGDFQDVNLDYRKTNLYGIRDCCQSNLLGITLDENGNPVYNTTGVLDSQSCTTGNIFKSLTSEDKSKLYNPYQQTQAMNLLNKLSNDSMEVFGWRVKYYVTDPDGKGIDFTLHEFQLYNIVCEEEIKVAVENNQFPDNQISMNQFDLALFETFQIHITKESFKAAFGVQRRPSKEDLIYFCDINRMFIVDHAQQFRNFNNAAVYYKVVLKKYNKAANVKAGSKPIENKIKELTKNSTIDELFGKEIKEDKKAIANKPQLQTLTRDPIRLEYKAEIVKDLIENSTTIVSKQHYDFSSLLYNGFTVMTQSVPGVIYKNINTQLRVSDNIGFYLWFNLKNYIENETYNFFDNYDENKNLGWKLNLSNDNIQLKMNSDNYTFSFTGQTNTAEDLYENVWYCYVMNIDQRNRTLEQWIYKRNVDIDSEDDARNLPSTVLEKVYQLKQRFEPVNYELMNIDARILASDIKMTNIRLFSEIIPSNQHTKILNQYIIADDSKYLIFADNASMKLNLPFYPYQ